MKKKALRNFPSLNALRAFEASARYLSFTKGAEELCVTQGAVSRHVKQLEDQLQVILFHRLHRQLILTDQGQILLKPLTDAFDLIAESLKRLENQTRDLKLKVHPSFAIRCLIPKLHRFQKQHPDIQVRFTTSSINVDFSRENFDVAITYRGEKVMGVSRKKILVERLTPVCSPAMMDGDMPLETPEDLKYHLLLHNTPEQRDWRTWAKAVGVTQLSFERGQTFETDDAALQAAASGLGIALGNLFLIRKDFEAKRLVQPFSQLVVETGAYYISWPDANSTSSGVTAFKTWLINEISSDS